MTGQRIIARCILMGALLLGAVVANAQDELRKTFFKEADAARAAADAVEAAIQAGKWRMISWHDHVKVHHLSPETIKPADLAKVTFMNLNTPEEFGQAEALARRIG